MTLAAGDCHKSKLNVS